MDSTLKIAQDHIEVDDLEGYSFFNDTDTNKPTNDSLFKAVLPGLYVSHIIAIDEFPRENLVVGFGR